MAFCEKCGKPLEDGQKCTCEAAAPQAPVENAAPKAPVQSKGKGKGKVGLIAVAAVIVVVLLISLLTGGKGYMSPVNDFMSAVNKKSTDMVKLYTSLMPDFAAKQFNNVYKQALKVVEDAADDMEDYKEDLEEIYEDSVDEYGKWKLTFEKKSAKKIDKDDLEDLQDECESYYENYMESSIEYLEEVLDDEDYLEDYADMLDIKEKQAKSLIKAMIKYYKSFENLKVSAGYEVKGKFVIKADDEFKSERVTFTVLKVNGDWTYYGITDGDLYFDDYYGYFDFIEEALYDDALFSNISF